MKTRYRVLTERGEWIIISSKIAIRNTEQASKIVGEKIIKVKIGTLIDQFKFWK